MNVAAYKALAGVDEIRYVGPINPPPLFKQKLASKLQRLIGGQGDFFFYSQDRLEAVAAMVRAGCVENARLDFFHGFTPWILSKPDRPYVAWSDCTFHDYIEIYHRRDMFRLDDLTRIEDAEAQWLERAHRVAFSNEWAAQRAIVYYGLSLRKVACVGGFGESELPEIDLYGDDQQFVFVSTDFAGKGGDVALSAFRKVRDIHPSATLVVVGDHPARVPRQPGVTFTGYLRKEIPEENARLRNILARAVALVHPTGKDVLPLIIVEAAYFGCPAISSAKFAIPELVDHDVSGILLEDATDVESVASAMCRMLDVKSYRTMRQQAWQRSREFCSKAAFERRLQDIVRTIC